MAGRIVVGVDGSDASKAALGWAAEEARLRNATLVAVHGWTFVPPAPIGDPGMLAMPAGDMTGQLDAERRAAEAELDAAVSGVLDPGSSVDVERKIVEGDPGEVLAAESEGADLVVVGTHGRTGLKAALLGSVSRDVVAHARCPVVVVKPPEQ
jgi:nucleotide-binding universal stress UspA family protein